MRILFYSNDYKPKLGGVAEYIYRVAETFNKLEHDVIVFAPKQINWFEFDSLQSFITLRFKHFRFNIINYIWQSIYLIFIKKKYKPQIIYCSSWFPEGLIAITINLQKKSKIVIAAHGHEVLYKGSTISRKLKRMLLPLQRMVYNSAYKVFAVSNYTKSKLISIGVQASNIEHIPNGIDVIYEEYNVSEIDDLLIENNLKDKYIVLTIARLEEHKGHDLVLYSLNTLIKRGIEIHYVIVGEGSCYDYLLNLRNQLKLNEYVHFIGPVSDKERMLWLAACDIFIMPSRETEYNVEGFGISFLEAHIQKKPTIGGNSGGIPDVIVHNETGILVNPNSVAQLTDAISSIIFDKNYADYLANQAYIKANQCFTWEKSVKRMLKHLTR